MTDAVPAVPELPLYADPVAVRGVALALLMQVTDRHRFLDESIDDSRDFAALSDRDRAFVRMVVTTTLRRMGQFDDLIHRAMDGKSPARPEALQGILRLGVCELIALKTPDHAAVDCAVNLAVASGLMKAKGLVNAVLRRVAREGRDWTTRQDIPRLCVPEWMFQSWVRDYGLPRAVDIAVASLAEAPLDLTVLNPDRIDHWAKALDAMIVPTGTLRLKQAGRVPDLPGFAQGEWWVQDAAAALAVPALGDVHGRHVADLCAAPGGKTAQLLARGAIVTAVDRSARRLQRLKENMQRLGFMHDRLTTVTEDAAVWKSRTLFDAVLLDAPCTATGTLRRHPDGLVLKQAVDVSAMVDVQGKLLDRALAVLKPGGVLVYAVCSLQREEGEILINRLIERRNDIRRLPITPAELCLSPDMVTIEGYVRCLPTHFPSFGGMDGFFIARLMRAQGQG